MSVEQKTIEYLEKANFKLREENFKLETEAAKDRFKMAEYQLKIQTLEKQLQLAMEAVSGRTAETVADLKREKGTLLNALLKDEKAA